MAQQKAHNRRMAEVNGLIEDLERDVEQLRQNIEDNRYASDAARERDARQLAFFLHAIAIVREMARELEEERANQLLMSIQEEMGQMNMGKGGNVNGNN